MLVYLENGERGSTSTNSFNFCSSVILSNLGELIKVHILSQQVMLSHLLGMNLKNLKSTIQVWQTDLEMDLKSSWSQDSLINHIFSIRHSDYENIVETINTIHLRQQLVDNTLIDSSA